MYASRRVVTIIEPWCFLGGAKLRYHEVNPPSLYSVCRNQQFDSDLGNLRLLMQYGRMREEHGMAAYIFYDPQPRLLQNRPRDYWVLSPASTYHTHSPLS